MRKKALLVAVLIIIFGSIWYLESIKPETADIEADIDLMSESEKAEMYEVAKEISTPDAFINVDEINITDLIGDQVVLIDFWTYSCINCQRTFPYLNAWHDRYSDKGLVIIGIHTPEFEFEKKFENVADAVERFGIGFPVVMDNDYSTWRSYKNRFWPRKYIIDIDGYVVYDHIGEGAYEETEDVIKDLLQERAEKLGITVDLPEGYVDVTQEVKDESDLAKTPEIYFGADRNDFLANGEQNQVGIQDLKLEGEAELNGLNLVGSWDIAEEYAAPADDGTAVVLNFNAQDLFMVAGAGDTGVQVKVTIDGKPVPQDMAGEDIYYEGEDSYLLIIRETLYKILESEKGIENHMLRLEPIGIDISGLQLFTFTFG